MKQNEIILEARHLKKYFKTGRKLLRAVDDVSFFIRKGETLGLVGESGCGKTTCGRTCIGIYERTDGEVLYKGKDIHALKGKEKKDFTKEVQIIFQDPYSSLDPKMKVGEIIAEGLRAHKLCPDKASQEKKVRELLETVGLNAEHATRYVHEFSGGQRQRIGIARALAVEPKLIVCDEPVSALDVSIQAQILNLLRDLQKELDLTCIFIGHGLGAVNYVSDRIAVMYLGKIVELADARELFADPIHPYSKALFRAVPIPDPRARETEIPVLQGEIASNTRPPSGCRFHPRCPYARQECSEIEPELKPAFAGSGHLVACPVLAGEENEKGGGPTHG